MPVKIFSAANDGFNTQTVEVEVDIVNGLPSMEIVGLGDTAVKEARQRVYAAIKNSGADFPRRRKIINLAPAHFRKYGPSFDFPIAMAILTASGQISADLFEKSVFVGELALNGSLRSIKGVLPVASHAQKCGFEKIFVPFENAKESSLIRGIKTYGIRHLKDFFEKGKILHAEKPWDAPVQISFGGIKLQDIRGQEIAKRALLVAASGGHNILMRGPPGSGKTMLAKALPGILPPLGFDEAMEVTKIHSLAGLLSQDIPYISNRPFREIYPTASRSALLGGGVRAVPGEISIAHRGILFLDEMVQFPTSILESLRQPIEEGFIAVQRASGTASFPAKFQLVGAMNPCPCGYFSDTKKACTCSEKEIHRYQKKLSGPLLDRIDIFLEVSRVPYEKLSNDNTQDESAMAGLIIARAKDIQEKRFSGESILSNSEMQPWLIKKHCKLNDKSKRLLKSAVETFHISPRVYFRLLRVARTIADIETQEALQEGHIAEALQYRLPDFKNISS